MSIAIRQEAMLEPLSPRERGRGEGPGSRFGNHVDIAHHGPSSGAARKSKSSAGGALLPEGEGKKREDEES